MGLRSPLLVVCLLSPGVSAAQGADASRLLLSSIRVPEGFTIQVYAPDVPGARSMAQGPKGVLFVGTREEGNVYAVLDRDGDQKAERVLTIARGLNMPNGVAFKDGALYVAEVSRVLRFDGIAKWLERPEGSPKPIVVNDGFPKDRHHGWKFIRFGPDGLLYVPVGAPCNVCVPRDPIYASITRMKPDGTGLEVFARGVRNTVGFDWHPVTKELWFTDNGRDLMGDDVPPDELNRAPTKGSHFGFPFCHGGDIVDPGFGRDRGCGEFVPPAMRLGPHVAALGMRFYTGKMFPASYRGQIFIAEHGSWNRSVPIGYRVTLVTLEGGRAVRYEPFAEGWLQGREAWGRPVDVEVMPDGALLVSDDRAGAIYRIAYEGRRGPKLSINVPAVAPEPRRPHIANVRASLGGAPHGRGVSSMDQSWIVKLGKVSLYAYYAFVAAALTAIVLRRALEWSRARPASIPPPAGSAAARTDVRRTTSGEPPPRETRGNGLGPLLLEYVGNIDLGARRGERRRNREARILMDHIKEVMTKRELPPVEAERLMEQLRESMQAEGREQTG